MSLELLAIADGTERVGNKFECDGGEWLLLLVKGMGVKEQTNGEESKVVEKVSF